MAGHGGNKADIKAKLYGPAIYQLRAQGKTNGEIAELLKLPIRSTERYFAQYRAALKGDKLLSRAVQIATDKMLELTELASGRYERWIKDDKADPKLQKIAFDASTNVLKSAKALTDRRVIDRDVGNIPHDELYDDLEALLDKRRRARTPEEDG